MNNKNTMTKAKFMEQIGMITISIIVACVMAEGITRTIDMVFNGVSFIGDDEYQTLYHENPFLYRMPTPNAQFQVYKVNKHGFRGNDFEMPKPPNVFRILTLGGSSTWDTNVSGTDFTWSAQLEKQLNKNRPQGKPHFEVVNGGVPGYNSAESLVGFIWRGLGIDPDAVLVYHGYNDFKPNRFPGFKADYSHSRSRDHSILRGFSLKLRFIYHLRRFITRKKPKIDRSYDTVDEKGVKSFSENLRKIAVLARDKNIQPIFSTFAMSISKENMKKYPAKMKSITRSVRRLTFEGALNAHEKYNEAVVSLGAELKIPTIDLNNAIPKDFNHFTDHCHMSDTGSHVAAMALSDFILSNIQLPDGLKK